jgi:hypothetical protein
LNNNLSHTRFREITGKINHNQAQFISARGNRIGVPGAKHPSSHAVIVAGNKAPFSTAGGAKLKLIIFKIINKSLTRNLDNAGYPGPITGLGNLGTRIGAVRRRRRRKPSA